MARIIRIPAGLASVFVIIDQRAIVVDTGAKGLGPRVLRSLARAGVKQGDVSLIVITHAHYDHTGNVAELQKTLAAPVAVHVGDAAFLRAGTDAPAVPRSLMGACLCRLNGPAGSRSGKAEPDIVFENTFQLKPYGVEGLILSSPGHTPGSCSVLLKNGDCLVGDLVMMHVPFVFRPSLPLVAVDQAAIPVGVQRLWEAGAVRVFPSHGGPWPMGPVMKALGVRSPSCFRP